MDLILFNNHLQAIRDIINNDLSPFTNDLAQNSETINHIIESNNDVITNLNSLTELFNGVTLINGQDGEQGIQGEQGLKGDSGSDWLVKSLNADVVTNSTSFISVSPSVEFLTEKNKAYEFKFYAKFKTVAATTGIGLGVDCQQGKFFGNVSIGTSNALTGSSIYQQFSDVAVMSVVSGAVSPANSIHYASFEGILINNGIAVANFNPIVRSEVSGSNVTLLAGSKLFYRAVNLI